MNTESFKYDELVRNSLGDAAFTSEGYFGHLLFVGFFVLRPYRFKESAGKKFGHRTEIVKPESRNMFGSVDIFSWKVENI